jgi:hypothetical protein
MSDQFLDFIGSEFLTREDISVSEASLVLQAGILTESPPPWRQHVCNAGGSSFRRGSQSLRILVISFSSYLPIQHFKRL